MGGRQHRTRPESTVESRLCASSIERIEAATQLLDKLIDDGDPVYGINTGFGQFADVVISPEKLLELQYNIVRSHCCGVGDLLPRDLVMAMWLIDLNKICRGHSGVRLTTLDAIRGMLEIGILGCVPGQGSVGPRAIWLPRHTPCKRF